MRTTIYELWHFPIGLDEDFDNEGERKSIGIYSSEANAKTAIERLKSKPGFRDWPEGFRIFDRWLDHDGWSEGYVNPYEDDE
jgi:hypothetical protein